MDSVTYPTKQAIYWQYKPNDKNVVIYTLGTVIWSYNFTTKQRYLIGNNMLYEPSCNERGWVVYSDYSDFCVYKIKTNGDSLTRLTYDGGIDAHWDYTDTAIYYFNEQKNKLYKINENGKKLDSIDSGPGVYSTFAKKSNKLFYNQTINGIASVKCLNISTRKETLVATGISGYMTLDDLEQNIYFSSWGDPNWAIIKYNLATQKKDTLLKNCDSHIFDWPHISENTNKLTIACIFTKFLDPRTDPRIKKPRLLRWTKSFEMNLNDPTHKLIEVNLFP